MQNISKNVQLGMRRMASGRQIVSQICCNMNWNRSASLLEDNCIPKKNIRRVHISKACTKLNPLPTFYTINIPSLPHIFLNHTFTPATSISSFMPSPRARSLSYLIPACQQRHEQGSLMAIWYVAGGHS